MGRDEDYSAATPNAVIPEDTRKLVPAVSRSMRYVHSGYI